MKRIIIICEGQTEQQFCNDVLRPYFAAKGIVLQYPTIKKTKGGIVSWPALKHQIEIHLKQDPTAFITTLIDYYGIYENHNYPNWLASKQNINKNSGMDLMEHGMLEDLNEPLRARFIPYIQLHEFEALLFSDQAVFDNNFEPGEFLDYNYLLQTIATNENPELINDGYETAPSKRLAKIIKGYHSDKENMKVFYGSILAHDIGLAKIRSKCPRFDQWITKLEGL